jgi:hypothetical protein
MARYDFAELTDYDFESLIRDLLERELSLRLELFTPGRDQGIDLRHFGGDNGSLIVQCKRWATNSWRPLLTRLRDHELAKIAALRPSRYILATSVQMTPLNKDQAVAALSPWLASPTDVIARDDILGLLARHPDVERRHIKLWLTSTDVLDAVVHSGIAARTQARVEQLRRQLRLWVPNPSFTRAMELLEEHHLCVISGAPGIGKTLLADVLLSRYAAHGYAAVVISSDIDEGDRLWRADRKQVFHYDDFLGRISLGELSLRKNEESRLASFVERVRDNPQKRFILTTREYILTEACSRYDRLHDQPFPLFTCVLSLADYTRFIRARILYNHLFCSPLPAPLRSAILENQAYRQVIHHRNYSPRVIAHAIAVPGATDMTPRAFVANLLGALDDPARMWELIYENLSEEARRILLALTSMPNETLLRDLEDACAALAGEMRVDAVAFGRALRTLEGTFVRIARVGDRVRESDIDTRLVSFSDASVGDYMRLRLAANPQEIVRLIKRAVCFEQCIILWDITNSRLDASNNGAAAAAIATVALGLLESANPSSHKVRYIGGGGGEGRERDDASVERRASFLIRVADSVALCLDAARLACEAAMRGWRSGHGFKQEALALIDVAQGSARLADPLKRSIERVVYEWFTATLRDREDFLKLLDLANARPALFGSPNPPLSSWRDDFANFFADEARWLLYDVEDPDWIEDVSSELTNAAEAFGCAEVLADLDRLPERVEQLRSEQVEEESAGENDADWLEAGREERVDEDREIDGLFDGLRDREDEM